MAATDATDVTGIPATPRPKKRGGNTPSESPVTTGTTDTPPNFRATPGDIGAAARPTGSRSAPTPPGSPSSGRTRASRPTARDRLTEKLEELLSLPSLVYSATGDEWAATFTAERARPMAEAWVALADENPAVKRVLNRLTETSAWGGVAMATAGTVLPLAIHHGLIPPLPMFTPDDDPATPIVPPPPPTTPPAATAKPPAAATGMTPPTAKGQPPGVVTVAGSNNNAV